MNSLDKVIEEARRQRFAFVNAENGNTGISKEIINNPQKKELLFFPRKKLIVKKMENRNLSESYYIAGRANKRGTSLEKPTELTGEALTSGLRCGIIMDNEGKYVKLKGIAPTTYFAQKGVRGLCHPTEAYHEHLFARLLEADGFPYLAIKPKFIETAVVPSNDLNVKRLVAYSGKYSRTVHTSEQKSAKGTFDNLRNFFNRTSDSNLFCISALETKGDTRLDEAIFHLTKKKLKGRKKAARDSILHYLSFGAGVAKAYLTAYGFSWGKDLDNTNSHIGNFAVYSENGIVETGIVDVCSLQKNKDFENRAKFLNHLKGEIEYFRENFYEDTACCFPAYLRYNNFPKKLREECFAALKTGYMACLLLHNNERRDMWQIEQPKRILFPENLYLKEDDFRKECERIMN